jgi:hypothetical protein
MGSRAQSIIRGLGAGAIGTLAMTGWQGLSQRLGTSDGDHGQEQAPQDPDDRWERAPVPAKVAKRILEPLLRRSLSADLIPLLTQLMHWSYGISWGAVYGLLEASLPRRSQMRDGAMFGTALWLMSYAQLVPMGLYDPPWRYPPTDLGLDLSYHLAYGAGTSVGLRLLKHAQEL